MVRFQNIKTYLLQKQKEVANKLRLLSQEETSLSEVVPESEEVGTSSWQADTDTTKAAIRQQLLNFSKNLQLTLTKIKEGSYGFCDKCKRQIEKERLEIIPTANLCLSCVN